MPMYNHFPCAAFPARAVKLRLFNQAFRFLVEEFIELNCRLRVILCNMVHDPLAVA